ncbi:MAG: helix-turn-helix transcriptional regulator [Prevotella sp.]|nr:helix-turn-helix transcriptional regulator [Prevotella sp.]
MGKNVNSKELAQRMNVSQSMVSQWLSRRRDPSLERLHDIAQALGVLVYELFQHPVKQ